MICGQMGGKIQHFVIPNEKGGPEAALSGFGLAEAVISWRLNALETGSRKFKPVGIHDLVPRHHKVAHELFFGIVLGVNLGEGAQLRI